MSEEISSPLLALVREQGMLDDLQYEDVVAEVKRNGTPITQVLQDFGILKLADILQIQAHASAPRWFPFATRKSRRKRWA